MRVLFYVEPHTIRDTAVHFRAVARNFLPLLECGPRIDARLFCNSETFLEIKDQLKGNENRIVNPTDQESLVFQRQKFKWAEEGIPRWLELMEGEGAITEDYLLILESIWRRFPFDVIVHWGENGAVTKFIEDRPITRIAMELGCTRSPFMDSIVMDPYGTNGSAVVPRLSVSDLRDIVGGKPMSRHEAMLAYSENLEAKAYEQQFQPLDYDLLGEALSAQKIAFLPLQLYDDANLLRFSPYDTLSDVVMDAVPALAAAGYTIIVKPHPASRHRPHSSFATAVARASLKPWQHQVIWLDETNTNILNPQLIALSDVVVTVNSSVGFEALYFDKPVVILGDAIYKPQGLFPTLDEFLSGAFDLPAYLDGIGYLRRFFLGGYLQTSRILSDLSAFERRVGLLDRLYQHDRDDPVAIAKGFWQVTSPSTQAFAESSVFSGQSVVGVSELGVPPLISTAPAPKLEIQVAVNIEAVSLQWRPIAKRLIKYSGANTSDEFILWLDTTLKQPDGLRTVVIEGDVVDPEDYLVSYPDVKAAGIDPVTHYVVHGFIEQRVPRKGISGMSQEDLVAHLTAAAELVLTYAGALVDFPLPETAALSRENNLEQIRNTLATRGHRVAVVAHLYYGDLVHELLERLKLIADDFDLIVTLPDWGTRRIEEMVRKVYPDAMFYRAANRGRDIGPFVDLLPILLQKGYDALLKVQTKRGYYLAGRLIPEFGDLWREESFDALLGSRERVDAILAAFRESPKLAMVGPSPHYLSLSDYPYHDHGVLARDVFGNPSAEGFFAGTMFWVRPECLRPLIDSLDLSITKFSPETGANDGALAHLIERMFGHAASSSGLVIGAPVDSTAALDDRLKPLTIRMHDRMVAAREAKQKANRRPRGALAW